MHRHETYSLAFAQRGDLVAVGGKRLVSVYNPDTPQPTHGIGGRMVPFPFAFPLCVLSGHTKWVSSVRFVNPAVATGGGHLLATASDDGDVCLWRLGRDVVERYGGGHDGDGDGDGDTNAYGLASSSSSSHRSSVMASMPRAATLPAEPLVIDPMDEPDDDPWYPEVDSPSARVIDMHDGGVRCMELCGRRIATGGKDYTVSVAELHSAGVAGKRTIEGYHSGIVKAVAFRDSDASVGGGSLAGALGSTLSNGSSSGGGAAGATRAGTRIPDGNPPSFSPGPGDILASCGNDKVIQLYDLRQPNPGVLSIRDAHALAINSIAFNPGRLHQLATSSFDGTVRLFDVRMAGAASVAAAAAAAASVAASAAAASASAAASAADAFSADAFAPDACGAGSSLGAAAAARTGGTHRRAAAPTVAVITIRPSGAPTAGRKGGLTVPAFVAGGAAIAALVEGSGSKSSAWRLGLFDTLTGCPLGAASRISLPVGCSGVVAAHEGTRRVALGASTHVSVGHFDSLWPAYSRSDES
jgi:WD40 repeat protein